MPSLVNLHFAIDEQLSVLMVRALSNEAGRAAGEPITLRKLASAMGGAHAE
jgi:hypothetical protein